MTVLTLLPASERAEKTANAEVIEDLASTFM